MPIIIDNHSNSRKHGVPVSCTEADVPILEIVSDSHCVHAEALVLRKPVTEYNNSSKSVLSSVYNHINEN